uniref:Very low-density lipoprotein receptor n=1 Tax=Cacopsylla melanoneura TaxID=428564 RepID=A0A8D8X0U9_9HEMI
MVSSIRPIVFLHIITSVWAAHAVNWKDQKIQTPFINTDCARGEFHCGLGKCIPDNWRCDGFIDCPDGTDEPNTCHHECYNGQVRCALSNKCIPNNWLCDEEPDCSTDDQLDFTDEDENKCHSAVLCPSNELRCGESNQCVPLSRSPGD